VLGQFSGGSVFFDHDMTPLPDNLVQKVASRQAVAALFIVTKGRQTN
jgi:hypothetical protein